MPATRVLLQIAVVDTGAFATAVKERRDAVFGQRIDIAGDGLTGDEAAAILSKVTGLEIRYEGFPIEVPRTQSENMALMFEWFDRTGCTADINSLRQDFPEVEWHDVERWARKQD
jgi:uncharacterized protein YbjT (DUF2867 family)